MHTYKLLLKLNVTKQENKKFAFNNNTYKLKTACMEINNAGTLKDSKKISVAFCLFFRGFRGASVNKTGCLQIIKNNNYKRWYIVQN